MTIMEQVGAEIRSRREKAGLSQNALGLKIGGDQAYVSRIEDGLINVSLTTLVKIAKALGCRLVVKFRRGNG